MSIFSKIKSAFSWLSVSGHRKKVYKVAKYVIPLAVVGGVLTNGQASEVLTAIALVLGFAAPHVADKNTDA